MYVTCFFFFLNSTNSAGYSDTCLESPYCGVEAGILGVQVILSYKTSSSLLPIWDIVSKQTKIRKHHNSLQLRAKHWLCIFAPLRECFIDKHWLVCSQKGVLNYFDFAGGGTCVRIHVHLCGTTHVEARGQPQVSAVPFLLVHCCVLRASWPASEGLVDNWAVLTRFSSVLWIHAPGLSVHGECSIHWPIFPASLLK